MKKLRIVICACWLSFWLLNGQVHGSTMPFRSDPRNVPEDDFVGLLISKSWEYLIQERKEPDFSMVSYQLSEKRVYNAKLVSDYLEVFRHAEIRSPTAPSAMPESSDKEKPQSDTSNQVIGLLMGISTYDPGISDQDLEWIIFIAVFLSLVGALIFGVISKLLGFILVVIWLIFWGPIVMAVVAVISFVNSVLLLF